MSSLMDTSTSSSTLVLCPAMELKDGKETLLFDPSLLQKQPNLPKEFIWPSKDLVHAQDELKEPLIDLSGFLKGNEEATSQAAELIRTACTNHGFFQVINHGVDPGLIRAAYDEIDAIFGLPMSKKLGMKRRTGGVCGYSGAHADRYSSKLPWKETFSFGFHKNESSDIVVVDYFKSVLGNDFEHTGWVYQKYCEAMKKLALVIMELLAISLGIERMHYRDFFEDGSSIMRCNLYPPCMNPGLAMGTGPHSDPTSLTILHQDQVGGLQVFVSNKWQAVTPRQDAFVVNIGDTFMALTNGRYKSCLHRALVNRESERRSLVFFVCPREDRTVRPPSDLLWTGMEVPRKYPDFTWSDLLEFTQNHHRADVATLQSFIHWLRSLQS
ncbi:LOW QUALITY PROTEIN: gibberellin 20 oxidase 2-like [Rhodamnia argentea]|uniref:LOW QUALITY PROTEIN: gibberellin 20 oxidase 2-like n=1 Tax=Rhodamnia argentea TaxID=178133 RepID=A0A8B8MTD8_9MYRT|nr:LOW QUALITY PROTEIN: gibberellin 20 oxidase 2-like [Rhodamnia argentea]